MVQSTRLEERTLKRCPAAPKGIKRYSILDCHSHSNINLTTLASSGVTLAECKLILAKLPMATGRVYFTPQSDHKYAVADA
jgi:hypothetical protein